MTIDYGSLMGSIASGAAVVLLAKLHLQKALSDLENVVKEMHSVQRELAAFAIKIEQMQRLEAMLHVHEKKIAVLESKCFINNSKI